MDVTWFVAASRLDTGCSRSASRVAALIESGSRGEGGGESESAAVRREGGPGRPLGASAGCSLVVNSSSVCEVINSRRRPGRSLGSVTVSKTWLVV